MLFFDPTNLHKRKKTFYGCKSDRQTNFRKPDTLPANMAKIPDNNIYINVNAFGTPYAANNISLSDRKCTPPGFRENGRFTYKIKELSPFPKQLFMIYIIDLF